MSKHLQCNNEQCEDGYVVEPPGSFYGTVGIFDCDECRRLFQRDNEYARKREEAEWARTKKEQP